MSVVFFIKNSKHFIKSAKFEMKRVPVHIKQQLEYYLEIFYKKIHEFFNMGLPPKPVELIEVQSQKKIKGRTCMYYH